jgi:hypothetical protein
MNLNYKELLPADFDPRSRVWIYQANRVFGLSEVLLVEDMINEFVANWNSHGDPVKGFGTVFFGQFIILMADESATGVSGCSTDSSVRLIKQIEQRFQVSLFDRQLLAFFVNDKLQIIPLSQLNYAVQQGYLGPDTLFFNNTVLTKQELIEQWIVPLKQSWLSKRLALSV